MAGVTRKPSDQIAQLGADLAAPMPSYHAEPDVVSPDTFEALKRLGLVTPVEEQEVSYRTQPLTFTAAPARYFCLHCGYEVDAHADRCPTCKASLGRTDTGLVVTGIDKASGTVTFTAVDEPKKG